MSIEDTIEQIKALPDDGEILTTGHSLDPLSAMPVFVNGSDLKALVERLERLTEALGYYARQPTNYGRAQNALNECRSQNAA